MTAGEITAFYRTLDTAERIGLQAENAVAYMASALDAGLNVDDADDVVRVLARVAFRLALRELRSTQRPWGDRYAGMGMRSAMRQWNEDQ